MASFIVVYARCAWSRWSLLVVFLVYSLPRSAIGSLQFPKQLMLDVKWNEKRQWSSKNRNGGVRGRDFRPYVRSPGRPNQPKTRSRRIVCFWNRIFGEIF